MQDTIVDKPPSREGESTPTEAADGFLTNLRNRIGREGELKIKQFSMDLLKVTPAMATYVYGLALHSDALPHTPADLLIGLTILGVGGRFVFQYFESKSEAVQEEIDDLKKQKHRLASEEKVDG